MARLDCASGVNNLAQLPSNLLLDSSLSEIIESKLSQFGGTTREENLAKLQLSEIKIANLDCAVGENNSGQLSPKLLLDKAMVPEFAQQLRATGDKYLAKISPGKGRGLKKWRRVRRELCNNALNLDVDFLVLATGYSLGIGSMNDLECNKKRIRAKDFGARGIWRKAHRRAFRDKVEASSVQSDLRTSDTGDAFSSQKHSVMSMSYGGEQSEDRQSEEVQSAFQKDTGGDEYLVSGDVDIDQTEEQNEENEWSWVPQDGDPLAESISSLQMTQEALESEMQKLSELSNEAETEDSSGDSKEKDVIVMPNAEVDVFEMHQKMEHLELKLKEASNTIREKDLRLTELQILTNSTRLSKQRMGDISNDSLEIELERQLQEKLEAEIQCLVMAKASQIWQVQAEDQIAFLDEHKLAGDNTKVMLKLQDTENKILMLKEQVEKLEVHEKELFRTTEVLKLKNKTFKTSLFSIIQLMMVSVSLWMFFRQLPLPFGEVVPT